MGFIVNRRELLAKMIEKGMNRYALCSSLGLTYQGLNNKINGRTCFTENEIFRLVNMFGSSIIFLPNSVTKNDTKGKEEKNDHRRKRKHADQG